MKYLASVISLIFLPKTLIWNEIPFPASNLLNFEELVENELMNSISKKINNIRFYNKKNYQKVKHDLEIKPNKDHKYLVKY